MNKNRLVFNKDEGIDLRFFQKIGFIGSKKKSGIGSYFEKVSNLKKA